MPKLILAAASIAFLAGCQATDTERALGGAAVGAVGSQILGGDTGTTIAAAAAGGALGATCDDLGTC